MATENSSNCEYCGKHYMKPVLGVFGLSSSARARNNHCSKKCYNKNIDNIEVRGNTSNNSNTEKIEEMKLEQQKNNRNIEVMRIKSEENTQTNLKVDEILKLSLEGKDLIETLNYLCTLGVSKPNIKIRNVIAEKMELGILKLNTENKNNDAEFYQNKMNKIKPNWFNKIIEKLN